MRGARQAPLRPRFDHLLFFAASIGALSDLVNPTPALGQGSF
jgi:hypothetical protein